MNPGIIPAFDSPGVIIPGQLGPISLVPLAARNGSALATSRTGIPSVMHTTSETPASAASQTASNAKGART